MKTQCSQKINIYFFNFDFQCHTQKGKKERKKERNQDSLEKWLILRLGQKIYKMNLEHLVVSKSKKDELNTHTQERNYVKKPTDRALMCKAGQLK